MKHVQRVVLQKQQRLATLRLEQEAKDVLFDQECMRRQKVEQMCKGLDYNHILEVVKKLRAGSTANLDCLPAELRMERFSWPVMLCVSRRRTLVITEAIGPSMLKAMCPSRAKSDFISRTNAENLWSLVINVLCRTRAEIEMRSERVKLCRREVADMENERLSKIVAELRLKHNLQMKVQRQA